VLAELLILVHNQLAIFGFNMLKIAVVPSVHNHVSVDDTSISANPFTGGYFTKRALLAQAALFCLEGFNHAHGVFDMYSTIPRATRRTGSGLAGCVLLPDRSKVGVAV